jgi:uncharacterized protein (TIRG00374 family)
VKKYYKYFHIAGYILLAVIIYFTVDFRNFADHLEMISLSAVIILVVIATLDRFAMAIKWKHLCSVLNINSGFFRFLKIYYVATFLGYCLPTSLGGEVYKAVRLSKFEKNHDVVASMFMEKIIGIFSTVAFAWAGVLYIAFNSGGKNSSTLFYILIGFTITAILATWISLHASVQNKVLGWFGSSRVSKFIEKLTASFSEYKNHFGVIVRNFLLALVESILQLIIMCGVAIALDLDTPLPMLVSIIAVTEFVRRVAIVLDGWGLATALQIFMYGLVGITGAQALLIALLSHAVHFIASLPGGILMLTDRWDTRQSNAA